MLKKAYLEITNICNLNCQFCPGTSRAKGFMTPSDFAVLAERLREHTEYLYLHVMGEPLLHPELKELLSIAEGLGFKVIITSNGILLKDKGPLLLASPAVHKLNISLQSFEANAGGELESYVNQCASFAQAMGRCGKLCVLRLWNSGGLESLNGNIQEALARFFPQPWPESRGSRRLTDRVWLDPGEKFDWPDMGRDDMGERCFCYGLRDQIAVLLDGTVVPCCLDREGELALGNLFHSSLTDIMSTELAQGIYDGFSQRRAIAPLCRRCGYARRFK